MTSIAFGRAEAEQGRRSAPAPRPHDGPEPWTRRSGVLLAVVLLLALAGITVAWAGAGGRTTLTAQRGWLALALGALILAGFGMVAWLLIGLRTVATLRRPVLAEVRRRKRAATAALPRSAEQGPPTGYAAVAGTRRFHRTDCLMLAGKAVDHGSAEEYAATGRVPCGVCLPNGPDEDGRHA